MLKYLRSKNINPSTKGKNVTRGWINIQCPFPGCDDHSNHLGINPKRTGFNCWKCGEFGHITKLIKQIEGCNWNQANKIASGLSGFEYKEYKPFKPDFKIYDKPMDIHIKYLKRRGYNWRDLQKRYGIKFTRNIGTYRFSIYIPCFDSYIIADCTSRKIKYQKGPNCNNFVFNSNRVKTDRVFLVEGFMDLARIDEQDTISCMGTNISDAQKLILSKFEKIIFLYDNKAEETAIKMANQLTGIVDNEIYVCEFGDPDLFSKQQVRKLKEMLI